MSKLDTAMIQSCWAKSWHGRHLKTPKIRDDNARPSLTAIFWAKIWYDIGVSLVHYFASNSFVIFAFISCRWWLSGKLQLLFFLLYLFPFWSFCSCFALFYLPLFFALFMLSLAWFRKTSKEESYFKQLPRPGGHNKILFNNHNINTARNWTPTTQKVPLECTHHKSFHLNGYTFWFCLTNQDLEVSIFCQIISPKVKELK